MGKGANGLPFLIAKSTDGGAGLLPPDQVRRLLADTQARVVKAKAAPAGDGVAVFDADGRLLGTTMRGKISPVASPAVPESPDDSAAHTLTREPPKPSDVALSAAPGDTLAAAPAAEVGPPSRSADVRKAAVELAGSLRDAGEQKIVAQAATAVHRAARERASVAALEFIRVREATRAADSLRRRRAAPLGLALGGPVR